MNEHELLSFMQRYVVNIAIAGSTLRNQGAPGVVQIARDYLAVLDLSILARINAVDYSAQLELWTGELIDEMPIGAKNWGTARKALNVFMVQVYLNRYLCKKYNIEKFADVLETPLDSLATKELRKKAGRCKLPRWESIKRLTADDSDRYQEFASALATEKGIPRACLDTTLWRVNS